MLKKLLLLSLVAGLTLGIGGLVQAEEPAMTNTPLTAQNTQETQTNVDSIINTPVNPSPLVKPGLTPDNFFYPLKLFFEDVHTAFTFGHLAKAKRLAFLAEKRMAEAKALTEKKKDKLAEKALDRYQKVLDNAVTQTGEASKTSQDATALQEKLSKLMENHLLVLDKVKAKLPPQAQTEIQKIEDRFQAHQEQVLKRLAQKNSQEACRLSQGILRRRLSLLHRAILAQKDKTADEKLAEWQHYVDLYQNICQKGEKSTPEALQEIDKQLQALREIQEKTEGEEPPAIDNSLQLVYEKIQQKHLEHLKAFEEKHPDKALPLMNQILQRRFAVLHRILAEKPKPSSAATMARLEMKQISYWLKSQNLNRFGDPKGTVYSGGSPLFDEKTGKAIPYFDYLLKKFPNRPWREAWKKRAVDSSINDYNQYLQVWKKIADRVETSQGKLPASQGEATPSQGTTPLGKKIGPQLYQFNNQRLEELKELYEKIPSEQKKKIEEMMVVPGVLRQRIEKNNPHLPSVAPHKIKLPEKVRKEIQTRIQMRNNLPKLRNFKRPILLQPQRRPQAIHR